MGKILKNKFISLFLCMGIVVAPFLTGCNSKEVNSDANKPIAKGVQWEVKKDNKTMYLIGTMHPINPDYNYFSDTINDILKKTDVLGVEIDPLPSDYTEVQANAVYSGNDTIEKDLNKKEIESLKDISKSLGLDYEKLKFNKSNFIIQNISSCIYTEANLVMETFDDKLIAVAKTSGKEVKQLETIQDQMKLLEKIHGIDALKLMLKDYSKESFEEYKKSDVDYSKKLMDSYAKGDEKFMEEAVAMQKENKEAYDAMILDRNVAMVKKMENYFKEDKTYTIAVGALHFFGDDSIVSMMKEKGYEVNKL